MRLARPRVHRTGLNLDRTHHNLRAVRTLPPPRVHAIRYPRHPQSYACHGPLSAGSLTHCMRRRGERQREGWPSRGRAHSVGARICCQVTDRSIAHDPIPSQSQSQSHPVCFRPSLLLAADLTPSHLRRAAAVCSSCFALLCGYQLLVAPALSTLASLEAIALMNTADAQVRLALTHTEHRIRRASSALACSHLLTPPHHTVQHTPPYSALDMHPRRPSLSGLVGEAPHST